MRECPICKSCFPDDVNHCPNDGEPTTQSISGEPVLDGRYLLEKRLGQGGMGVVFKARHVFLKTQHAIKVILPDLVGNDPMLVTRFRQEALAAAAIRHQNIIAVTDFGVARGTMPFLVMEFVNGESLHDMLMREKALSPARAIEIMAPICAGVAAAHRQGIVHRDLKPLNVMLQEGLSVNEAVKILDFGLAKIKSNELLGSFVQAKTTGLMGSPYYMAPEQWADEEPDAQADIYSLAVMFFQMLAGDVPFKGNSFPAIMKKHVSEHPPTFSEMGVQVPHQVESAVRHALEKDRGDRTKTVEDFISELKAGLSASTNQLNRTMVDTPESTGQLLSYSTGGVATEKLKTGSIYFQTTPPHSSVFVNNNFMGSSDATGKIVVEGIPLGNHKVRVSHDGYQDWEKEFNCQETAVRANVVLKSMLATHVMSQEEQHSLDRIDAGIHISSQGEKKTTGFDTNISQARKSSGVTQALQQGKGTRPLEDVAVAAETGAQNVEASTPNLQASQGWQQSNNAMQMTMAPAPSSKMPIILSAVALTVVIGFISIFVLYKFVIEPRRGDTNGTTPTPTPTVKKSPEMAFIKGGKFMMGRKGSRDEEGPPYEVNIKDFFMDKTEVTNSEYFDFILETGYPPPQGWIDGKTPPGQENFPVVYVNVEDAEKFAEWRSKRDSVRYRLPTEEEWEYAARNGAKDTLYPWGNELDKSKALIATSMRSVGSIPGGANEWGVMDLIGNASEWTSSSAYYYPGNNMPFDKEKAKDVYMYRGGYASLDWNFIMGGNPAEVTSTLRQGYSKYNKTPYNGFRLVRSATAQ